ncbi:MAG: hypothetical protein GX939_02530 [Clostridiaceae bacterium]|jgi:hypothetical protein|nr:hypothetical protein [Clostridiaceae bacterium]
MKKLFVILLILVLLLTSCGAKEEANERPEKSDQFTKKTEQTDDTGKKPPNSAEGTLFDGRKGEIPLNQELERYGSRIIFDYVLFDDDPGLFSPPPEGFIFMYPVLTLKNEREDDQNISFASQSSCVATVDGEEYIRSMDALYSYSGKEMPTLDTTIKKGISEQVYTGMVIPEDWKEIRFVVNQMFDGATPSLNMIFELKRDSGMDKEVQVLEAGFKIIFQAAPRLSPENYLSVEEIEEITGLYNVGELEPFVDDRMSQIDYFLHADPDGSPGSSKAVELRFDLYYAKDELTYDQLYVSGSQLTFDQGRGSKSFVEDVPNLGDDAYWMISSYRSYPELRVLVNDDTYGPFMIALSINENGDKEILVPLAERTISNLNKLNEG